MDWMDFVLKFSSEILVLILAGVVSGANVMAFYSNSFADSSLAENFLIHHSQLNPPLYARLNSIVTVVSASDGLFPKAQADDFVGLDSQSGQVDSSALDITDDNGINAPNPDSIKGLVTSVSKKVYTVVAGDSLKSIAAENDISVNSIKWSNQLSGDTLGVGWTLIIPPANGVTVTADANTTLPDLAAKYSPERYNSNKKIRDEAAAKLLDSIISYNGLDSAEDINDGDFIFIPGGVVTSPPAPPAKPKTPSGGSNSGIDTVTSIGSGYDGTNHLFPKGYCTYYVASKMKITFGGNAKNWLANARASGYMTGQEPAVHSAVVMTGNKGALRKYGHVAYIESVNGDGTITLSEMNYDHFNRIDTRTISVNDSSIRGYIYQ